MRTGVLVTVLVVVVVVVHYCMAIQLAGGMALV